LVIGEGPGNRPLTQLGEIMFFEKILAGAFTLLVLFAMVIFIGYLVIELPYVIIGVTGLTLIAIFAILGRD
jgi:hypothetical protein